VLLTTGAAGGLTAALLVGRWGRTIPPRSLTAYGTVIVGAFMLAMYNQRSLPMVMALNFLMFVPVVASGVGLQTMFQRGVNDNFRGRVFGALNTTIALVGLASLWLSGVLAELLGIVTMLSVAGGVTIVAGVLAFVLLPRNEATENTADEELVPSAS
jgi:MFS family permease